MDNDHYDIIRSLIAAQVATLEHANEELGIEGQSKAALISHLEKALKMAKKLEN